MKKDWALISECREAVSRQVWDLETREFESHHSDLFVRTVARHQACIGSSKNAEVIELVVKT